MSRGLFLLLPLLVACSPRDRTASPQTGATTKNAALPERRDTVVDLRSVPATGGPGSSGSSGVEIATLIGDPSEPGPYVQLLRVRPNTRIEAHGHVDDRVGTVLEGTWLFGFGRRFDRAALKELPPGSIYTEPSGRFHFGATGSEPVVVQITGQGPTDTSYADPSNDPNNKKAR